MGEDEIDDHQQQGATHGTIAEELPHNIVQAFTGVDAFVRREFQRLQGHGDDGRGRVAARPAIAEGRGYAPFLPCQRQHKSVVRFGRTLVRSDETADQIDGAFAIGGKEIGKKPNATATQYEGAFQHGGCPVSSLPPGGIVVFISFDGVEKRRTKRGRCGARQVSRKLEELQHPPTGLLGFCDRREVAICGTWR